MLMSFLRRWFTPSLPSPNSLPMCIPEWSESMAEQHGAIWRQVKPYTMTSIERVVALCQSVAYLENHGIPGAIVECGVWKGGSIMASALALLALQSSQIADLTAMMASIGRAQSLDAASRAAAQAQGQEQLRRFLTPGAGYQPGTVSMFHN